MRVVGVELPLFVASLVRQTLTQIHNSMAPISASKAKRLAEKVRPPFLDSDSTSLSSNPPTPSSWAAGWP